MNPMLTSAEAQHLAMEALTASLAVLDAGTRLDRVHPVFPRSQLGFGKFEPCYDDNTTIDGPHRFSVGYWVVGGTGSTTIRLLAGLWTEWGWAVDDRSGSAMASARATSPDGYRLVARLSADGDVSLGVSSPPFPFENGRAFGEEGAFGEARVPGAIGQK